MTMRWSDDPDAPPPGTRLARLADLPDGEATPIRFGEGRSVWSVVVVRRGDDLRGFVDLCPHVYLPLTHRGTAVLSADGERLVCSNHGLCFSAANGAALGRSGADGLIAVPLRLDPNGAVHVADT